MTLFKYCADMRIRYLWDPEALVWIADSEDVPGLVLEGASLPELVQRVRLAVPELLELNSSSNRKRQ